MAVEKIIEEFVLGLPDAIRGNVLALLALSNGDALDDTSSTSDEALTAKLRESLPEPKNLQAVLAYSRVIGALEFAMTPTKMDTVALHQELAEKHPESETFAQMAKEAPGRKLAWDQARAQFEELRRTTLSPIALRDYADEIFVKNPIRPPTFTLGSN